jgi:hypothetical protein
MMNPFEYRELMMAHFGYTDKTVDQVLAEHKRRDTPSKSRSKTKAPEPSTAPVPKSEMEKLAQLLAKAKPRPAPPAE